MTLEDNKPHLLAVYGTLKKGYPNHHFHLGNAYFLGNDRLHGFAMFSHGGFPAVSPVNGEVAQYFSIQVEVFRVNDNELAACDRLEGVGTGFYERIEILTKYGRTWIYIQSLEKIPRLQPWVPDGLWCGRHTPTYIWQGIEKESEMIVAREAGRKAMQQQTKIADIPVVSEGKKEEPQLPAPKPKEVEKEQEWFGPHMFNIEIKEAS